MEIKQYLYITDAVAFARGDMYCYHITDMEDLSVDGWVCIGPVTINVSVNEAEIINKALAKLEQAEQKVKDDATFKLKMLAEEKSKLLAITYQGEK